MPGKPDIVFVNLKIAIFCDSEFWHGYNWEEKKRLGTNREFWIHKIETNMERDKKVNEELISKVDCIKILGNRNQKNLMNVSKN